MPHTALISLARKNLVTYAVAAIDSTMFRHLYVYDTIAGEEKDALAHGDLSCASFVSTLLSMIWLIDRPHATVPTTVKAMYDAGWVKIDEPREGAVVHWPANEDGHEHVGICLDDTQVVSNSSITNTPQRHGLSHPVSGIQPDFYLWHADLERNF